MQLIRTLIVNLHVYLEWAVINSASTFTICNGQHIIGGYGVFNMNSQLMRNFELPPHHKIYIDLTFYRIDSWNSDYLKIFIDDNIAHQQQFQFGSGSSLCGLSQFDDQIAQINIEALHTNNFAVIQIVSLDTNGDNDETWGLSRLTLSIEPCPQGCQYCEFNQDLQCRYWSLAYFDNDQTRWSRSQWWYYNSFLYNTYHCDLSCQYFLHPEPHYKLMIRFRIVTYFINQNVQLLIDGIQFASKTFQLSYGGVTQFSKFEIQPFYHSKRTIVIKINQPNQCTYIKDLQVLILKDDTSIKPQIQGCEYLINDICQLCENGWVLNYVHPQCLPKCGDSSVIGDEECDDGNDEPYDGCYQCKFQCQQNCRVCEFGICKQCQDNYDLDLTNKCNPICGDGIVIPYMEQCDDMNTIQGDGCYDCQLECQKNCRLCKDACLICESGFEFNDNKCLPFCGDGIIIPYDEQCDDMNDIKGDGCYNCKFECQENCIFCNQEECFECENGFQLINNQCLPICGDKIVIPYYEECDDGNDQPNDGCYECKFQCNFNCDYCYQGLCKDECSYGEVMINNMCQSVCGDSIAAQSEDCDDGNDIPFDGCFQCKYSCPQFCDNCKLGECEKRQFNYVLENKSCMSIEICGNGFIGDQEECDDENTDPNDGCTNCKIDDDWICNSLMPSECTYSKSPYLIVTILNQTFSTYYIQVISSQQVKIESQIPLTMSINITNLEDNKYNFTILPIIEASQHYRVIQYKICIQINQQMTEKPILQLEVNEDVINQNNVTINNPLIIKYLEMPFYLNPPQKQQSQQLLNLNQKVTYALGSICLLSFLMGESSIFSEIIYVLQYQSYLKFINLQFPENLFIYFEASNTVSLQPLLALFNIQLFLGYLSMQQTSYTVKGKFQLYQLDPELINNLISAVLQFLGVLFGMGFVIVLQRCMFKRQLQAKYFYLMSLMSIQHKDFTFFLSNNLYKMFKNFCEFLQFLTWKGIRSLLLLNSWDLLFKTFLYLDSLQLDYIQSYIQVALSGVIIIVYSILLFTKVGTQIEINEIKFQLVTLCRQIIFLLLLVFGQFNQVWQTVLISLINLVYLLVLIDYKCIKKYTNITHQIIEGTIFIFTLSSIVYFDDFSMYISPDYKIMIGFVHIFILSLAVFAEAAKFMFIKGKILYLNIKMRIIKFLDQKSRQPAPLTAQFFI